MATMTDDERYQLRKHCRELQFKLEEAQRERDDLVRDLESMCLADSRGATFNGSSVLQERIFSTEKELSAARAALAGVSHERDNLREDLGEVREAKRRAEAGHAAQLQRAAALDRELAFYQAQSARVMADRDRAVWEGEQLKGQNLELEQGLREASARAETERAQRAQLERQLAEARQQLRAAQAQAAEAAALPGLRQELAASAAEVERLRGRERQLEAAGDELRRQLGETHAASEAAAGEAAAAQRAADELAAAHAVVQQQLRGEVAELQAEAAALRQRLEASGAAAEEAERARLAAEAAVAAGAEQREADVAALVAHHGEEVGSLRSQLAEAQEAAGAARQQAEQATRDKVAALVRLSEAEGGRSKAGGRIERLTQELAAAREQLEQAKREKVDALVKLAAAGAGGPPPRNDSARGDGSPLARSPVGRSWWSSPVKGAAA